MAPKAKRGAKTAAKKKDSDAQAPPKELSNVQFANSLNDKSSEGEIKRFLALFPNAFEAEETKEVAKLLKALFKACSRICSGDGGLHDFINQSGHEAMKDIKNNIMEPPGEEGKAGVPEPAYVEQLAEFDLAFASMADTARKWISSVDHVDFMYLPLVIDTAHALGHETQETALAVLDTVQRFAGHQVSHRLNLLEGGILVVLHRILCIYRQPEMVTDTLQILFRVTDLPESAFQEDLVKEIELIKTVGETLQHAPVNFRLQLMGFRLLAMWAQSGNEEIEQAVQECGALDSLKKCMATLTTAGYANAAAWMSAAAGRTLQDVDKRVSKLLKAKRLEEAKSPSKSPSRSNR